MSNTTNRKPSDWFMAICLMLALFAIFIVLYYIGVLHVPSELKWYESHSDGFLLIISIIAVIGAIWAILARIDAENAFKQAKEANDAATDAANRALEAIKQATKAANMAYEASLDAKRTYNSFGDSFEFESIFNENKLPAFLTKINDPEVTKLTFFLGFPCVGVFYDGQEFRDKSFDFFVKLINELNVFKSNAANQEKEIKIAYLDEEETDDFIQKSNLEENFSEKLRQKITEFKDVANDTKKIEYFCFKEDPKYRFVIAETKKTSDSIMWVVSDFEKDQAEKFKSAGFMSSDINFFHTLEILYGNLKKKKLST